MAEQLRVEGYSAFDAYRLLADYAQPLTADRLFGWHAALFPTGRSGIQKITAGNWRDDSSGPMQVVSGPTAKQKVHYEAPPAPRVPEDMDRFLSWFEAPGKIDPLLIAGLAHVWFVTIHPFEDGNGRIARAITDMALARSEQSTQRFYSMSAQIRRERSDYYTTLERTQKGTLDITPWQEWFLSCLLRAVEGSQDTAYRDILDLVERGALRKDPGGGRSTSYSLVMGGERQ